MTGREVRMTEDRTSIAEMPIRIQSVTKGMRTVILTKNLTMTGCVVQGDDWVVWDLAVCRKPESHTVPVGRDLAVCKKPELHTGTGLAVSRCAKGAIHTPMMWKCDVRLK